MNSAWTRWAGWTGVLRSILYARAYRDFVIHVSNAANASTGGKHHPPVARPSWLARVGVVARWRSGTPSRAGRDRRQRRAGVGNVAGQEGDRGSVP